jgi:hydroxymethylglutaryl-CoA lyase
MSDLPRSIEICEKGPREGIQMEPGPIPTDRKIALIDALAATGIKRIQVASFVNPKRVPGWADADAVVTGLHPVDGVQYTALWLNLQGLERALGFRDRLTYSETVSLPASEKFSLRNQNRTTADNIRVQQEQAKILSQNGIPLEGALIAAAFGCNFQGDISIPQLLGTAQHCFDIAAAQGFTLKRLSLNDTMAWATPESVKRVVGAFRERWPALRINLHFHNTRGLGLANAYAGLQMGIDSFDSSVGSLGGCPFAGHKGAAGNISTEDLVFLCEELGIETGIDLEALIEAAKLAEDVVGHPLPGSVMRSGTLNRLRAQLA